MPENISPVLGGLLCIMRYCINGEQVPAQRTLLVESMPHMRAPSKPVLRSMPYRLPLGANFSTRFLSGCPFRLLHGYMVSYMVP